MSSFAGRPLRPALLALEDGRIFRGRSFGAGADAAGELVFNTAMTGYQEILTDPSYRGQMVIMTYPHIGNYGIIEGEDESRRPWVEAFIVKEVSRRPSNFRAGKDLDAFLREKSIPGVEGIDTRALTRHIRERGALKAVLSSTDLDEKRMVQRAKESPGLNGRDLVRDVTCAKAFTAGKKNGRPLCVAYDFGGKNAIFELLAQKFDVEVVPAAESAEAVLSRKPAAVFLSNGPGDPAALPQIVRNVEKILGKVPVVGICLGHQILGQALGGKTFKLKFGHHGANHPVMDLNTRKVDITSQNHSFAVDPESLPKKVAVTHLSLNDKTCEGLLCKNPPVFSVQYHPEASPGPHDARGLFDRFLEFCVGG